MQLKVKKRLLYGTIAVKWIMVPAYMTLAGCLSTDIINGTCVSWGAYSSYAAEKIITLTILIFTYLLPMTMMVFYYARIVHSIRSKVTSTLSQLVEVVG